MNRLLLTVSALALAASGAFAQDRPVPPRQQFDRGFMIREPYVHGQPLEVIPRPELAEPSPSMEALVRRLSELGLEQSQRARREGLDLLLPPIRECVAELKGGSVVICDAAPSEWPKP
jgi:hypothetical protein